MRLEGNDGLILVERKNGWAFLSGFGPQECAAKLGE